MSDPRPVAEVHRRRFSPVWLVPIGAAAVVGVMAYEGLQKHGPVVTLALRTADGVAERQTELRYRGVVLGTVEGVRLAADGTAAEVRVRVDRSAERWLTDRARFWVVRPQVERTFAETLGGLETVVTGVYIEMDPGSPGGRAAHEFKALDAAPKLRSDELGTVFVLTAARIGWLGAGAPVYFHDVKVGRIVDDDVHGGAGPASLSVFVASPYDRSVHPDTQFWRESGVTVSSGAGGLHLALQSIEAALSGAVAFDNPPGAAGVTVSSSPAGAVFALNADEDQARASFPGRKVHCATYVGGSVEGLARGSPVQALGLRVGAVTGIAPVPAAPGDRARGWRARIAFDVDLAPEDEPAALAAQLVAPALEQGNARAVVESASLVTSSKRVSLDYAERARAPDAPREGEVVVVPGESGDFAGITSSLGRVASALQRLPLDDIGKNLDGAMRSVNAVVSDPALGRAVQSLAEALAEARGLVRDLDQGLTPALQRLPAISDQLQQAAQGANATFAAYGQDSAFERGSQRLLRQVSDAARSVRILADFLDRHPEALLQGRPKPPGAR